jgi:hypothetical protein
VPRRPGIFVASLPLLCGGFGLSQPACTSQTAVALWPVDAAPPASDSAPPPADRADAGTDVVIVADLASDGADVVPFETPRPDGAPDVLTPAEALPTTGILFSDGFEGGYEVNWLLSESSDGPVSNATDGDNPIVTLDSTQTDYSRIRCNLSGDKFTATSITASMRLRIDTAPTSTRTVRLDVRQAAATANVFYAVGAVVNTNGAITKVSIFKKVPDGAGDFTICDLADGPLFATPITLGQWRTIRLTVSGTTSVQLTALFEDLPVATFVDDCTSPLTATNGNVVANPGCLADQTGIGIQVEKGLAASIDDVLVTGP